MTKVISLQSAAAMRLGRGADETESQKGGGGLLHAISAMIRRRRNDHELLDASDRYLRDIGLTRRDVARIEWPSRGGAWITPPGAHP